jgi:hypothetical protein
MIYQTNFNEWIVATSRWHAWSKSKYELELVEIIHKSSKLKIS